LVEDFSLGIRRDLEAPKGRFKPVYGVGNCSQQSKFKTIINDGLSDALLMD